MDRYDPNDWTPGFVRKEQRFCKEVLRNTCRRVREMVQKEQYEPAVAGLDRILNGLVLLQNHADGDYRPHICFCSWAEAEIIAFGITNATEEKRRIVALQLLEDARDYARNDETRNMINAIIRDLRSEMPLASLQKKHDPDFPHSILEMLATVVNALAPSVNVSTRSTSSSASHTAADSENSGKGPFPAILIAACILGLGLLIWNIFTAPKKATTPEPLPSTYHTESPPPETQDTSAEETAGTVDSEASTEADLADTYVVKTKSGNGLNLREGPDTGTEIVKSMPENSPVTILKIENDWAYVSFGDLTGWCKAEYLVPENSNSADASDDTSVTAKVTTKSDELRLREKPSLDSEVIAGMPNGSWVTVLRQEGEWCYVDFDGVRGWCSAKYLTFS